ncbi:hypothetical protein CY34DRAFT_809086 [Suillus luteus UH-Slu-Lm8-n1]|uniref:Uncharacterized protein n=1 Tax=Suillus luteus UH-Slu-Lm8-n1 TaxID=930992 RepID=A0A0D0AA78_9AGAM|nr:hypothetical protein CY34DRAFT_809086 [Suillus luteus UH-Slu-Lm8-n1]
MNIGTFRLAGSGSGTRGAQKLLHDHSPRSQFISQLFRTTNNFFEHTSDSLTVHNLLTLP